VGLALLPDLGAATHALDHSLNLPRRDGNAAGLRQMPLGLQVSRFIGSFQTDQLGQGRGVTDLQTQRRIDRIVTLILALVVVVIPLQLEAAKDALNADPFPALARLSGVGVVLGVDSVGGALEQPTHQGVGGFENRRAHQDFQLGDGVSLQLFGFKTGDQLLDFFFLGQEDFSRDGFFFLASAMFWRVSRMTKSAYCWVSCRYWT